MKRFGFLRVLAWLYVVLSVLGTIFWTLYMFWMAFSWGSVFVPGREQFAVSLVGYWLLGVLAGLSLCGLGMLILAILSIEENSRFTADEFRKRFNTKQ
jgi:hypothetical protein